jgi:hypothetical protein
MESQMECPKCRYVRQEKDSIVPDWQCPSCGVAYAKVKAALSKFVKVRMVSGQELQFNKVKLYDLILVQKLENLRQAAVTNLSGYSSGLGFWGSLEWVAVGSIITGMIDSSVSNQMAKQGINQLAEVANLATQIRHTAVYVQISSIENIKYPDVGLWRATAYDRSPKREMIHIASNYVFVEMDGKEVVLFWDKIEQYELIETF